MRSNHWNTILSGRQIGQKVNSLVANQLLRSPFDVHAEKLTSPTPTLRHATHTHIHKQAHTHRHTHTRPCPAHLKLLHNSCWWCCEHWYSSRKRGQLTREMPTSFHLFPPNYSHCGDRSGRTVIPWCHFYVQFWSPLDKMTEPCPA